MFHWFKYFNMSIFKFYIIMMISFTVFPIGNFQFAKQTNTLKEGLLYFWYLCSAEILANFEPLFRWAVFGHALAMDRMISIRVNTMLDRYFELGSCWKILTWYLMDTAKVQIQSLRNNQFVKFKLFESQNNF